MAIMNKINLHQFDSKCLSEVSEESGVVRFFSGNILLYATEAINLKQKLIRMFTYKDDDLNLAELFSKSDYIQLDETKTAIDALLNLKVILEKKNPEFNSSVQNWKTYVYLAINPAEFPFVKITEYTEEDWFYIGPFRSRFFITDVMELMSRLLKLPYCEVKQGPCEKQNTELCRGWCMLINPKSADKEDDVSLQPHLQKLDALLKEAYVHPDNGLLEMLISEKDKYNHKLEFEKADLLTANIELLEKYKQWLVFLYKIKSLNFENDKICVQNGQLIRFKIQESQHTFPHIKIAYRPNEILAINKNLVDEGWILFRESVNV